MAVASYKVRRPPKGQSVSAMWLDMSMAGILELRLCSLLDFFMLHMCADAGTNLAGFYQEPWQVHDCLRVFRVSELQVQAPRVCLLPDICIVSRGSTKGCIATAMAAISSAMLTTT